MEVAALLHGSQHVHTRDSELTPAEEKAMKAMSLQEVCNIDQTIWFKTMCFQHMLIYQFCFFGQPKTFEQRGLLPLVPIKINSLIFFKIMLYNTQISNKMKYLKASVIVLNLNKSCLGLQMGKWQMFRFNFQMYTELSSKESINYLPIYFLLNLHISLFLG